MRMQRISPKMPAVVTPIASATAMQPSGIASMAPRVEIGCAQLAGVARSSRTGTKRSVKAGPTMRLPVWPENGIAPLIQQWRMPCLSSIVVMVAVVTVSSVAIRSGARLNESLRGERKGSCGNDKRPTCARLALGNAGEPQAFAIAVAVVVVLERIDLAEMRDREFGLKLEKLL